MAKSLITVDHLKKYVFRNNLLTNRYLSSLEIVNILILYNKKVFICNYLLAITKCIY